MSGREAQGRRQATGIQCCGYIEEGGICRLRSKSKGFSKLLNLSGTLMNTRTWLSKKQGGGWHTESRESFKQVHECLNAGKNKAKAQAAGWLEWWVGKGKR